MGKLWEVSQKIDEIISHQGLDKNITRGQIGMEAGVLMNMSENTADNDTKLLKLKMAVAKVLDVKL